MTRSDVYAAILEQALGEQATIAQAGDPGFTGQAEAVGDALYRLCVEFGVPFNEFKRDVLAEAVNRTPVKGAAEDARPSRFLPPRDRLPLIILALELMREDSAF